MKEESRQVKLAEYQKTGQWPGAKVKETSESNSWSIQQSKRSRKADRKRKKELKRHTQDGEEEDDNIIISADEEDDLEEDYRLLKKMKKKVLVITISHFFRVDKIL